MTQAGHLDKSLEGLEKWQQENDIPTTLSGR
jgi:hypothetical protein